MYRIGSTVLFLLLVALAPSARGLENVVIVVNGVSNVSPDCERLSVNMTITADVTDSDEPTLDSDYLAVVAHDGSGKFMPASYYSLQSRPRGTVLFAHAGTQEPFSLETTLYRSSPLTIRVHDIADPRPSNSVDPINLIAFASKFPVEAEITLDPATHLPQQCGGKPFRNREFRILRTLQRTSPTAPIGATPVLLDLNDLGSKYIDVAVPGPSELVALFRARCSNDAADDASRANVDILVDGVAVDATAGSADALCTSNGVAGHDQWVMARASGGRRVAGPGTYRVEVRASSPNGGETRLDKTELTVMVPEPGWFQALAAGVALGAALGARRGRRVSRGASDGGGAVRRVVGSTLCVASLALVQPSIADADTTAWHTFTTTDQIHVIDDSGSSTFFDLGSAGAAFEFVVDRRMRVAIVLTAECAIQIQNPVPGAPGAGLDVDILLDFNNLPVTDSIDDTFCSAKPGSTGLDGWVSASIHTTVDLDPGLHRIEVRGGIYSGADVGDRWSIGNLSLLLVGQSN